MDWFKWAPVGRYLAWLLLSFGVLIAGVGVLGTGVALALEGRQYTDPLAQFVPSLYFFGMALGSMSGRYWLRWLGALKLFTVSAIAGSVFCLLVLLATTPVAWGILRLFQGACLAGIYISVEVVLNTATVNRLRARTVALYQVVTYAGMAVGQWMVGYLWWGEEAWFITASTLLAAGGVLAWSTIPGPPVAAVPQQVDSADSHVHLQAQSANAAKQGSLHLGLYVAGIAGVLLSSFYTVFPLVVHDFMKNLPATGNYLAVATLTALPSLLLVAQQADRHGRKRAIFLVAFAMTCTLLLLALYDSQLMLWGGGLVYSGLVFTVYGLGVSDINDRVEDDRREAAAAWLVVMFSLGGCLGPWLSRWAYSNSGASGYFVVSACAASSMLLAGLVTDMHKHKWRRRLSP
ncbi:MAG: MFS transporter [Rhodoferax sp.]